MLIMREAYYGTTRFDDFARRVGITKAATSARLAELVDLGLLTRQPYREPGQRSRDEYVLTEAGVDFMPVVWAMFEWGRRHLPGRNRLRLTHLGCGAERPSKSGCTEGHLVPPRAGAVANLWHAAARIRTLGGGRHCSLSTASSRRAAATRRAAGPVRLSSAHSGSAGGPMCPQPRGQSLIASARSEKASITSSGWMWASPNERIPGVSITQPLRVATAAPPTASRCAGPCRYRSPRRLLDPLRAQGDSPTSTCRPRNGPAAL